MTTDRVAGAALVGLALVVFWASRGLPLGSLRNPGPAYLPVALALVLLGFGALLVALGKRAPAVSTSRASSSPRSSRPTRAGSPRASARSGGSRRS